MAIEPQRNPPPGWYPDPARGPQPRYWDGMQWHFPTEPPKPPTRIRRRMGVIVAVAAVAAALIVAVVVSIESMLGPSLGELTDVADRVSFPPRLTMVDETSTGNRMCLEECVRLSRTYVSTMPAEAASKSVVTALERAGYRCVIPSPNAVNRDWCGNFDVNMLSYWERGTASPRLSFVVHPIPSAWASTELADKSVDPSCQSYVVVYV